MNRRYLTFLFLTTIVALAASTEPARSGTAANCRTRAGQMVTGSDSATLSCPPTTTTGQPPLYGREAIAINLDPGAFVTFDTPVLTNCTEFYNSRVVVIPDNKAQLRVTAGTAWCTKPNGRTVVVEAGTQHIRISADPVFGVGVDPTGTVTIKVAAGRSAQVQTSSGTPVVIPPNHELAIAPGIAPKQSSVATLKYDSPLEFQTVTCLRNGVIPATYQQAGQWLQDRKQNTLLAISQPSTSSSIPPAFGKSLFESLKSSYVPGLRGTTLSTDEASKYGIADALRSARTVVVTGDINSVASTLARVRATVGPGISVLFVPAAPVISSVSPAVGPAGSAVTITGSYLSGVISVSFNGVPAQVTSSSSTSITTVVPATATTGDLTVVTAAGTATTSFIVGTPPAITAVSPTSGRSGTSVTITGVHFSGVSSVAFGGVSAAITASSDTSITVVVPTGAAVGTNTLTVTTPAGSATASAPFTVTSGPSPSG